MTGSAFLQKTWPWGAAASSGVLLSLCFPGYNQSWLAWIALAPLLCALWFSADNGKRRWLKKAGLAMVSGVVFFCMTFSWLTTVTGLMSPQFLGHLAWFGLMCYMALYFALWGWFAGCIAFPANRDPQKLLSSRHNLWLGVVCALGWVAQEWLRGNVFGGFGWNNLGDTQHAALALIQITDITGVAGLSFLIALSNVIAVVTVRRFAMEIRNHKLRPHFDFTLTITLVGLVFAYGARTLLKKPEPGATIPVRVTAIQANIPQDEKYDEALEEKIFTRYTKLSEQAMATKPQLLLWPEAATPSGIFADETNFDFVTGMANKVNTNFLLGTIDFDENGDYNIAALLTPGGGKIQTHRKMHLVPFGEYIPLRDTFPLFAKLAGDLVRGDFHPGTQYNVLEMHDPAVKIGALICFEDTLADLTRHFTLNGAQLLVNVTNDAWFLKSVQSEQHVAMSVFRAVENRRPLVRCANTGVTCFIDAQGRIVSSLRSPKGDPFIQGFLSGVVNVPVDGQITFYARHGEWLSLLALVLALAMTVAHFFKRQRA